MWTVWKAGGWKMRGIVQWRKALQRFWWVWRSFWWVWSVLILLIVLTLALHHLQKIFFPTNTRISTISALFWLETCQFHLWKWWRIILFLFELKHIIQNLTHSTIRTSKTFWCRPARILRCQIRLQYHLLHMWPHTSHQSPGFSRWELDSEGLPWQKIGRDQIYVLLFYGFVQTCRRRPSDIHTHPLVLFSRSRIHDCLCWERNLVSLLDVAVRQLRSKCLIYVWCC